MDADEHEQLEIDFESLLDAALGIESLPAAQHVLQKQHAGANTSSRKRTKYARPMVVGSPVAYDQLSPSCSPTASPVHCYQSSPCSPCMSSSSDQMHAALPGLSSGFTKSAGMYSPVRECGSPGSEQMHSPAHGHAATTAPSCNSPQLQQPQGQHDQVQQPLAAGTTSQQQQQCRQHHVQLCTLPLEVQMRVLCFLSADALSTLGCCSRQLCSLCSGEPVLWRRLFVHRWGKKIKQNNTMSWKARYMERDASELRAAGAAANEPHDGMQDMFVQALLAKRQQSIGRGAVDDAMLVDDDEIAAKVAAWRRSRGFELAPGPGAAAEPQRPSDLTQHLSTASTGHRQGQGSGCKKPGTARRRIAVPKQQQQQASTIGNSAWQAKAGMEHLLGSSQSAVAAGDHGSAAVDAGSSGCQLPHVDGLMMAGSPRAGDYCAASAPTAAAHGDELAVKRQRWRWTQIGHVFCDEMTGWVHVCDETCSEKIIEPDSGLLVCPVSGAVSDRMMTCAEEEEEGPLDGDTAGNGHADEDYSGEKGRLARAFAAGYYCSDEHELLRTCGVRLSH